MGKNGAPKMGVPMDTSATEPRGPSPETLSRFAEIVGGAHALTGAADMQPYLVEWRDKYFGRAAMVLRPGSVDEVSQVLALACETRTAIVPQGGNTGLVGAQIPFETGNEIVLSLGRLNRVRDIDPVDNTVTVDAGCVLQSIQEAADEVDRLFPLRIGSEGSCQIGGNIGTNAGGTAVLAYGNMRDLVLGLEVVLADGRIWNGLRRLRKDNTGYDLKHLFIGSEGTLGVVTGAVLKLFPKPKDKATAMIGLATPRAALSLLELAQDLSGRRVTGFEIIPRFGIEIVLKHGTGVRAPLEGMHDWHVLMELSGGGTAGALDETATEILERGLERGLVEDAVVAASEAQAGELWRLREVVSEVQKLEGGSIKFDVSVPVSCVPDFIAEVMRVCTDLVPDCRPLPFGHMGDGNIHCNVSQPVGADRDAFLARWADFEDVVFEVLARFSGSISAEHGIGRLKRDRMPAIKDPVELDLMYMLKHQLDPNGILNPGKVLPERG